jgi:hypothetical protein
MVRPASCLALLLSAVLGGGPALAQVKKSPPPAKATPEMAAVLKDPLLFYLAKGEPDACGPGCSEWIAAEGYFDRDAPQRLREVLNRLGKRKLPVFFHSPGGLGLHAMTIGRMLRERGLTAGVFRTIPVGCAAASEEACRTLKRSGEPVAAELHNVAACASACVFALVGAKVRLVPPGARVGVHSAKFLAVDPDGRARALWQRNLARFLHDMQMADELFDLILKTPFEQSRFLTRNEIAAFGIDTREFQETRWIGDASSKGPVVTKLVLEATGAGRKQFLTGMIWLSCASPRRLSIVYARGLGADEVAAARSIKIVIDDRSVSFGPKGSVSKLDAIDPGGSFEARSSYEPFELFEVAAARGSVEIVESDPTNASMPQRTTKLSTHGLVKALEELRRSCGQPPNFADTPAVQFLDVPGLGPNVGSRQPAWPRP